MGPLPNKSEKGVIRNIYSRNENSTNCRILKFEKIPRNNAAPQEKVENLTQMLTCKFSLKI